MKLDEKISGLMSTKEVFDVQLTVLAENDIDQKANFEIRTSY